MEAIIFLSIIIALFSIFVSCLVIRRVKKQIAEITDALADVKNGNGNRRILSATNELVAPLAYEINEIVVSYEKRLSTVRQAEETNRQLMTSLSHDVRTPLTTLIGGMIIGSADHILYRLLLGVLIGVMVAVSILPVIAIECLSKKGYIFSIILSFIYASASFAIVFAMSNVLSPLSAVFRWALPHMTTGPTYGLDDWFLSSPACIGILILTAIASLMLAIIYKSKQEI